MKIPMKLVCQYMVIFFNFSLTSNHLHPLQVENCDSNSRFVVDEDDNGKFRLERVNAGPGDPMLSQRWWTCPMLSQEDKLIRLHEYRSPWPFTHYNAGIFLHKPRDQRCFFQFENIINVFISSIRCICLPVLSVYGLYKCFTLSVRGSILDVRIWRLNSVPDWKG